MEDNDLQFSVDSHLLGELGERLVTKNHVALSELIKNAYDADATKIAIKFVRAGRSSRGDEDTSEIHLIDDGHGMTYDEVLAFWMRVATPNKIRNPISARFGRPKTGDKGLGRFACQRLAHILQLESRGQKQDGRCERTKVLFNWAEFEPGSDLTKIPCKAWRDTVASDEAGLVLKLIALRDVWTQRDFDVMRRQILMLSIVSEARREDFEEDPGFEVVLDAPEFRSGEGYLADQFMNAGWGTLKGMVDARGNASFRVDAKGIGSREYSHAERFGRLGGVSFEIAWIPIQKEYYRDPTTLSKAGVRNIMKELAGIKVYLRDFRVYPYGNPGDDWLNVDRDVGRRKGTVSETFRALSRALGLDEGRVLLDHPRQSSLVGRLHLPAGSKHGFKVKMDREGLVENQAFDDLRRFVRDGLEWFTLQYAHFRMVYAEERLGESLAALGSAGIPTPREAPAVKQAVTVLRSLATSRKEIPGKVRKRAAASAEKVIIRTIEAAENRNEMLRAVASVGPLVFTFAHEVKGVVGRLETHASLLSRIARRLPAKIRKELERVAQSMKRTRKSLDQQIRLFGLLAGAAKPEKPGRILVKAAIESIKGGLDYFTDEFGIRIDAEDIPKALKTGPMLEAEFYSIVINLLSNAMKALLAGRGRDIKIEAQRNRKTVLRFLDTGIGLSSGFREQVFEPLATDPEGRLYGRLDKVLGGGELAVLGRGSGLGLGIVRDVVEAHGGSVRFVDVGPPWKTAIEVVLP